MVVKTELCNYTEYKIYPGHGRRFVRRDGKLLVFLDSKCESLYHQKIKAQKLTWSQQWRRINKKVAVDAVQKKKRARSGKVYKAIQGITIEDIRKRRNVAPEARKAKRDAAVNQIKQRKKAANLTFTVHWRKLHKKRTEHRDLGKKTRKIKKVEREWNKHEERELLQETLDEWLGVQRNWMYLESIFLDSDDIRLQLPEEAKKFDKIQIGRAHV